MSQPETFVRIPFLPLPHLASNLDAEIETEVYQQNE